MRHETDSKILKHSSPLAMGVVVVVRGVLLAAAAAVAAGRESGVGKGC
jgi:hypothetical protein